MADEKKNTSPEDEYQFPQEEYIASGGAGSQEPPTGSEEPPPVKKSPVEKIMGTLSNLPPIVKRNQRVVIVIIVLLVIFLILHFGIGRKKPIPLPVTQPVTAPVATPQPMTTNGSWADSLSSLRQHSSQTTTDIQDLRSQVSDLQNTMSQMQSENTKLQSAVTTLSEQVSDLSTQLSKLTKIQPVKKVSPIVFHIRAMIPDRAWIASNQGTALSVSVGDHVPSYGKVTAIHAEVGIVDTSSGRKIMYGPNDR